MKEISTGETISVKVWPGVTTVVAVCPYCAHKNKHGNGGPGSPETSVRACDGCGRDYRVTFAHTQ